MDKNLKKYLLVNAIMLLLFAIYVMLYFIKSWNPKQTSYKDIVKSGNILFDDQIQIPAVAGNAGVLTTFNLIVLPGEGQIFVSLPPFFDREYQVGFLFSKEAVCKLYENCNNYTYLFYSNNIGFAEGFSGTAGFSLLILSFFENKTRIVNYPITGFMLSNGIIAPVSGIDKKLEATLKEYPYLVAPKEEKNILPAYTILDVLKIYFNKSFEYEIEIPEDYNKVIEEVALDICDNITKWNIKYALENKRYYTAASLCYREKSESFSINLSDEDIEKLINDLEREVKKYQCNSYQCEEIKYQVVQRLEMAKNLTSKEKYWRYYTAKGWFKFMKIADRINRTNTCDGIMRELKIMQFLNPDIDYSNLDCFKARELLAKTYIIYLAYREKQALDSIINLAKYFMTKNGFSISAYNYLQYAEDLYDMGDKDSAFYYAVLSLEYAI